MSSAEHPAVRRAAVLGSPVAHSLSPVLHTAGYRAAGLTGWRYDRIECDAGRLPGLVTGLSGEWAGLSVTMPGKAVAARFAATRSPRVAALAAANTLIRTAAGWHAENTDIDGILGALGASAAPPPEQVLVLGGGGTAVAVVAALAERYPHAVVTLAGRRPQSTATTAALAGRLGLLATEIALTVDALERAADSADLVVSTVPAGVADRWAAALARVPVLFDVVYHPWPTVLAAAGGESRITITGLDLLLHQALRQFELITGVPAPGRAMRDALRAATGTELPLPLGPSPA